MDVRRAFRPLLPLGLPFLLLLCWQFFANAAPLTGDLNYDGRIDGLDLGALMARWGSADTDADLNADGTVGTADMQLLLGLFSPAAPASGPAAPLLDVVDASTALNPYPIGGEAAPGITVRLYINGISAGETLAGADGRFAFNALLVDGVNYVHARSDNGARESLPSATRAIEYLNSVPRAQGGTFTGTAAWTPGLIPEAYLISGDLTIAAGATLILAPGAELRFAPGAALRVEGTLSIAGQMLNPAMLRSDKLAPAAGDWTGITVPAGGRVTIEHALIEHAKRGIDAEGGHIEVSGSTLREFNADFFDAGIRMANGATGIIADNLFEHSGWQRGIGILLSNASPSISGNLLRGLEYGIRLEYASAPYIHGGNEISENKYGVYLSDRFISGEPMPNPRINGNSLYANSRYEFLAEGNTPQSVNEWDLSGNWWGSALPGEFTGGVSAYPDYAYRLAPFLDAPGGAPVAGHFAGGRAVADTLLDSAQPIVVLGNYIVDRGVTLSVVAGNEIRFATNARLRVAGTFKALGSESSPVLLSATLTHGAPDQWHGIHVNGGQVSLAHTILEHAGTAIDVFFGRATVSRSSLGPLSGSAVVFRCNGFGAVTASHIHDAGNTGIATQCGTNINILDNHIESCTTGIRVGAGAPYIRGNLVNFNNRGIELLGTDPVTVTGNNVFEDNLVGVYVWRDRLQTSNPAPVVTGNAILNNAQYNYYAENFIDGYSAVLDAGGNWWGSTDVEAIAASISQPSDSRPVVQFTPYLDGPGGTPVTGGALTGTLAENTTLGAISEHEIYQSLVVPAGVTLTIEAGATLRFSPGASLIVHGVLDSLGSADAPILMTSNQLNPVAGDWRGIVLNGAPSRIRHTEIAYATSALEVAGATAYIENNRIRDFSQYGVYLRHRDTDSARLYAGGSISGNHFLGSSGIGIYSIMSSPTINGNTIENLGNAVYLLYKNSSPISDNTIRGNGDGITLSSGFVYNRNDNVYGKYYDPAPVVSNNAIYGSLYRNVNTTRYYANPAANLDMRDNWWGTSDAAVIADGIIDEVDRGANYPLVVFEPFLSLPPLLPPLLDGAPVFTNQNPHPLSGRTDAGMTVNLYVNGALAASALAAADGRFSAQVNLTEGNNYIHATTLRSATESTPSATLELILDTNPPAINISAPPPGGATNRADAAIQGSLSEQATLSADGLPLTLDKGHAFTHTANLSEGMNIIVFSATDRAGNTSTFDYSLELDITPPTILDASTIVFGPLNAGAVTVNGGPGSLETGVVVKLINGRSGIVNETASGASGDFNLSIEAQPADPLSLMVFDAVGNFAPPIPHTVAGTAPAPAISIDSPGDAAFIQNDQVGVYGTYTGAANSSVRVNGIDAGVYGNRFFASIPLLSGLNPITATIINQDGTSASASLSITADTAAVAKHGVEPFSGVAPLEVEFRIEATAPGEIAFMEIDTNGDGLFDLAGERINYEFGPLDLNGLPTIAAASARFIYVETGIFDPVIRTIADNGAEHEYPLRVAVQGGLVNRVKLRNVFTGMLDALRGGDVDTALLATASTSRDHFRAIFEALGPRLADLATDLENIRPVRVSGNYAEYLLVRTIDNRKVGYRVTMFRGEDGIWRVEGM